MCEYEMDLASIVEDTERTWFCSQMGRQTDRQMDGQGETSMPPSMRYKNGFVLLDTLQVRFSKLLMFQVVDVSLQYC